MARGACICMVHSFCGSQAMPPVSDSPIIACLGASSFLCQGILARLREVGQVVVVDRAAVGAALGRGGSWPERVCEASFIVNFAWDSDGNIDSRIATSLPPTCDAALVLLSTRSVYNPDAGALLGEGSAVGPTSDYGRAKLSAELGARQVCSERGRRLYVLRLANVFGFEFPARRRTFMSTMLHSLHERREIVLDGDPQRAKDLLPLAGFADLLAGVVGRAPAAGIYNVGSGVAMPLSAIAAAVIRGHGSGKVRLDDSKPCVDPPFVFDVTKLRSALGGGVSPALTRPDIERALMECGSMLQTHRSEAREP